MVDQLNFPIEIHVVETKRDSDGLALSSRNRLLSLGEREIALQIPKTLFLIETMAKSKSLFEKICLCDVLRWVFSFRMFECI